ncbi:hypothetical protein AKJ09_09941 [Labilithrix luteola]|uniref:Uncharacterized protein n=1 Tax=Labilithrix luteola TaxID=1391654 RepID=A0A0K1QC28_9BACT|nr:hypothetical protein AKJ09_09941 [Labilithrix luteola]
MDSPGTGFRNRRKRLVGTRHGSRRTKQLSRRAWHSCVSSRLRADSRQRRSRPDCHVHRRARHSISPVRSPTYRISTVTQEHQVERQEKRRRARGRARLRRR